MTPEDLIAMSTGAIDDAFETLEATKNCEPSVRVDAVSKLWPLILNTSQLLLQIESKMPRKVTPVQGLIADPKKLN